MIVGVCRLRNRPPQFLLLVLLAIAFLICLSTADSVENGECDAGVGGSSCDDDAAAAVDEAKGGMRLMVTDEGDKGDDEYDVEGIMSNIQKELDKQISEVKFTFNINDEYDDDIIDGDDNDIFDEESIISNFQKELEKQISEGKFSINVLETRAFITGDNLIASSDSDVDSKTCVDDMSECKFWATNGECEKNPNYMLVSCQCSCMKYFDLPMHYHELLEAVDKYGVSQEVLMGSEFRSTINVVINTVAYMETQSSEVVEACRNQDRRCSFWSGIKECKANVEFMKSRCAPACQACDLIDIRRRCPPLEDDATPGLAPGEMNHMFERIVRTSPGNQSESVTIEDGMVNHTVRVYSRPEANDEDEEEPQISFWSDVANPPWIIALDDFLTEEERYQLILIGDAIGYNTMRSHQRASKDATCTHDNVCHGDPIVERIRNRIAKVTGIPRENSEYHQIVGYEPGNYYRTHHDYVRRIDRGAGPRVLTFFVYLSDVEEGGDIAFPKLDVSIKPKAGRAVLWPLSLNSNPSEMDPRTESEVKDVKDGAMYGVNAWLHLHDYLDAHDKGCV